MTVKKGDFIRIDYTEFVDDQAIATTEKALAEERGIYSEDIQYGPHLIVMGAGQLVKGFEDDLVGKEIGYSGRVELGPEDAFGLHDPKKIETVPLNRFKEERPVPGMQVSIDDRAGTVSRVIGRKVSIDFNHPLAGKTVVYEYSIREAVEDQTERLKALIRTFGRVDLEAEIKDEIAVITIPWELNYYKEWIMIRRGLADLIIQHLGMKEVHYIEKHKGERVRAELISPPGKESEAGGAQDLPQGMEPKTIGESPAPEEGPASVVNSVSEESSVSGEKTAF
ncbi:MAG: peptidylprolyl isomerase [Methanothrix sp.]|uniref:FKBP-type peptidyl-prolyl cis-trans isomerase n=1 Tax=Methanothrix sp. TaxID=90426 RepID=UPI001BD5125E|nr:peptidylprolyl isomerase [Methanothrix sp.]